VTGQRWALGLMSGTSRDGIDAALIRTDGVAHVESGPALGHAYPQRFRDALADVIAGRGDPAAVERELTDRHAAAVEALLAEAGIGAGEVAVVGFHGHTIAHAPARGLTRQIGDGSRLAARLGLDVVADFRSADVAAGGQGAPLAPYFHRALAHDLEKPCAVLNLGGVGNVTWLGPGFDDIAAFDTGPGNALLDDLVARRTGSPYDADGRLSAAGQADPQALARLLDHPFFARRGPKSLDRDDFDPSPVAALSDADAAATLAAFTARSVALAAAQLPSQPVRWLVTGGGRRNPTLMRLLQAELGVPVASVDAFGWDGDVLEAQAFAYLAVRTLRGLPLSGPSTTGVARETCGGALFRAPGQAASANSRG
jgi:anhydro-N-acetylmuramic acid kinase